jgi:hypothetical protein
VKEVLASDVRSGLDNGSIAISKHRSGEGNGRVLVATDEEISVVEGHCRDADEELTGPRSGLGDLFDLNAVKNDER